MINSVIIFSDKVYSQLGHVCLLSVHVSETHTHARAHMYAYKRVRAHGFFVSHCPRFFRNLAVHNTVLSDHNSRGIAIMYRPELLRRWHIAVQNPQEDMAVLLNAILN